MTHQTMTHQYYRSQTDVEYRIETSVHPRLIDEINDDDEDYGFYVDFPEKITPIRYNFTMEDVRHSEFDRKYYNLFIKKQKTKKIQMTRLN